MGEDTLRHCVTFVKLTLLRLGERSAFAERHRIRFGEGSSRLSRATLGGV